MAVGVAGLKLEDYWVHGAGAAKIGWGLPGSFDRCVTHLGKYVKDPKGLCAEYHHAATGKWPGEKKGRSMETLLEAGMTPDQVMAIVRANPKPYGNVKYADPKNGKYPIDTAAHAKAAWSYINQADNAAMYPMNGVTLAEVKARIMAACKKFGIQISENMNSADPAGEYRTVPFELGDVRGNGDGLTFEGYAAVYNTPTRISGWNGDFDEQIAPGAFRSVTDGKYPVLMFEHGKHPLIGTMPLGRISSARDETRDGTTGLWIEGRLTDNWLIQPVRDAVRDKAVTGMSFRFLPPGDDDQRWDERSGQPDLRTLLRLDVPELGPVVFPAYEPTTAVVRSALDSFEDFTGRDSARSAPGGERMDGAPGSGSPSSSEHRKALRDRAWKMRSIR